MYSLLVFIHIVAAVMGLGAAFGFPIVVKCAKTASQAKYTLKLLKNLELLPKIGSITLLVTGIVLGIMNPSLFKAGWYIASIVLYFAAQVIVIGMLPKKMKEQADILANHTGEDLPASYTAIGKQAGKLEGITHLLAFLLIVLMYFKPF
ncbi:hypothetical protein SD70_03430 [Gordoniibacillus kamchatkensis]|uniref:DUF2269 family protein n=1 Tax=Gordoniibacillus kamchatkensis TaxID=1590651 RepID=A0ABR5ALM5_9BACL|nr:DUF2269 family protein [Paenibacillus sp. VKM B-2647]KIL41939.1 hypothetical protein SD70_03430 [Paenibacillus sp. VKM B-2647]